MIASNWDNAFTGSTAVKRDKISSDAPEGPRPTIEIRCLAPRCEYGDTASG